jgi:hypothetical protein
MVQVIVTADQARLLAASTECVEIVDANGKRLGTLLRPPSNDDVRIAKDRIAGDGKRYTTDEVVARLRSLEQS